MILTLELFLKVPTYVYFVNATSDNILPSTDSRLLATSLFQLFLKLSLPFTRTAVPHSLLEKPVPYFPSFSSHISSFSLAFLSHSSKSAQSLTSPPSLLPLLLLPNVMFLSFRLHQFFLPSDGQKAPLFLEIWMCQKVIFSSFYRS